MMLLSATVSVGMVLSALVIEEAIPVPMPGVSSGPADCRNGNTATESGAVDGAAAGGVGLGVLPDRVLA